MKPTGAQTLHVLSATHWDREWLLPFLGYRRHLVHYTDELLDILERDPAFRHYHMDGQTICVEDYLAVRPEQQARIRRLVEQKRLFVGPWYTLPDMPLLSGESVIRNLLIGIDVCTSLGGAMREGYTACSNGQIAQLPQIYAGFDIHSAIIYKGISDARAPREFLWRSPDGTEILGLHLAARYGRGNFYCLLYHEVIANVIHDTDDNNWYYEPHENWAPFRVDGLRFHDPFVYQALHRKPGWHERHLQPYLAKLRQQASAGAATSHLLGFHGMDHTPPLPATPRLIAAADRVFADLRVIDSSIPDAVQAVRDELPANLAVHTGELRDAKAGPRDRDLYWPTLSAQLPIKIANRRTEHLLQNIAEPLAAWAWLSGAPYPARELRLAWNLLLANQAHDSIDGCSLDKVADDILARFGDCQTLCEGVIEDACIRLVRGNGYVPLPAGQTPPVHIVVFNPSPYPRGGCCAMNLDVPASAAVDRPVLVAGDGTRIMAEAEYLYDCSMSITGLIGRSLPARRYRLRFELPAVAPMHWSVLRLENAAETAPRGASLSPEPHVLENEFLRITVRADGTFDLLHKTSGRLFPAVHAFEDVGDGGDPWHFKPTGKTVSSRGQPAAVTRLSHSPLESVLQIAIRLAPHAGSNGRKPISIVSRLTLRRGSKRLDIATEIDNPLPDHRLRVCFPTGLSAARSYAGSPCHVDERNTRPPDMTDWIEPVDGHPAYGFCGLSDGSHGLAVLNMGLPEYFVSGDQHDVLTVTLLRATQLKRWPKEAAGERAAGAQCLGRHTLHYALYPHAGDWRGADVLQAYREFAVQPVLSQILAEPPPAPGESLLCVAPASIETLCIKKAEREDALVVRLWNPLPQAQTVRINVRFPFHDAMAVNLNEDPLEPQPQTLVPPDIRGLRAILEPHRIATFLFRGVRTAI